MCLQIESSFFPHLGERGNIALNINEVLRLTNPSIFATFIMGIFVVKIKQNRKSETLRAPFAVLSTRDQVLKPAVLVFYFQIFRSRLFCECSLKFSSFVSHLLVLK